MAAPKQARQGKTGETAARSGEPATTAKGRFAEMPGTEVSGLRAHLTPAYHVIARENHWSVKKFGAQRAARIFTSQPEAVDYAVKIATPGAMEVIVHRPDGSVARRISPQPKAASK